METRPFKSIQQLAQEALDVQDACNLSGVVHGFSRAITDLRAVLIQAGIMSCGTDVINQHPICVLWADKIAHLTKTQVCGNDRVSDAYQEVHNMASGSPQRTGGG